MEILEKYFAFYQEDLALDFIYDYLHKNLKSGYYNLVDDHLKAILDNPKWWQKGIDQPILSLAFAMWTHHEPTKFKHREEFMNRLYTDYVSAYGVLKADRLLVGLMKGIKMSQTYDNKKS
jgi:hypothetical protein